MPLIYITGMPGSGKSAVRNELLKRGYEAYGTDEDSLAYFYNNQTGEPIHHHMPADKRTPEWRAQHTWKVSRSAIEKLRENAEDKPVFLCGVVANDASELWDLFDEVFALSIDEKTLRHRITTRTNDDYGKNPHEFANLLEWAKTAEEDYEKLGATSIDATQPVGSVVDEIVEKVNAAAAQSQTLAHIHLRALKPNGKPHQSWSSSLVLESGDWIITHSNYATPVRHHTKDLTYVMQHSNLGIFNTKEYYNVFIDFHKDGTFKMLYINVATPAIMHDDEITWTDLELDVVRMPGKPAELVDEDEFQEAKENGLLPLDLAKKAEKVAVMLMQEVDKSEFPFLVTDYVHASKMITQYFDR